MKRETYSIKEFMDRQPVAPKRTPIKAYSIAFNPLMLFDPTFILIGASVVLVAFLEKQLANTGFVYIAAAFNSALKIAFPVVAVGALIYLIKTSSFLF